MLAPFEAEKSPSGTRPSGLLAASFVVAEIQRSADLHKLMNALSIIRPDDAEQPFLARLHCALSGDTRHAAKHLRGGERADRGSRPRVGRRRLQLDACGSGSGTALPRASPRAPRPRGL